MADNKNPLKCPLCGGGIKAITGTTFIKCEHGEYANGQASGCDFFVDLKPKILKGKSISRDQIAKMLSGETVNFGTGTGVIDKSKPYGNYFSYTRKEDEYF